MSRFTLCALLSFFCIGIVYATGVDSTYHEPVSQVIPWVTLIFLFGIIGRYLAERMSQPGVLGELFMGFLLGNLCYYIGVPIVMILREGAAGYFIMSDLLNGMPLVEAVKQNINDTNSVSTVVSTLSAPNGMQWLKISYAVDVFSRYGVIFLLFMVGLETSVDELKGTGKASLKVAILGVIAPFLLAFFFMSVFFPAVSYKTDLFVGATLAATSVGITARVLKEMKKLKTREAKTILGAAMIDDILGLILLAIVSSMVVSDAINVLNISHIVFSSVLFFALALLIGPCVLEKTMGIFKFLDLWEAKLFISFVFVMLLAWVASLISLATIIGAFAAGIIINEKYFYNNGDTRNALTVHELVAPLEFILAPLFFMLIGIQVKIEMFFDWQVLLWAMGLIVAAILGKIISGYGGDKEDNRLIIGIGMMPRGEVGLLFASIGKSMHIISEQLFAAIILMVFITTIIVPPWLKYQYSRQAVS